MANGCNGSIRGKIVEGYGFNASKAATTSMSADSSSKSS